jgi:hypothetical protein
MKLIKNQTAKKLTYLGVVITALTVSVILSMDAQDISTNIGARAEVEAPNEIVTEVNHFVEEARVDTLTVVVGPSEVTPNVATPESTATAENPKIQIALIMDTSGSMEGLIEQAKSQLWGLVGELTHAK